MISQLILKATSKNTAFIGLAGLYVLMFGHAGATKLTAGQTPEWFISSFSKTFLGVVPGAIPASFYLIAFGEVVLAAVFTASILSFLRQHKNAVKLLELGLMGSLFLFIFLGFGQRLVGEYSASAQLFYYAGFSFLFYHCAGTSSQQAKEH